MDEKRLREIEEWVSWHNTPQPVYNELVAEIRRLQGMVDGLMKIRLEVPSVKARTFWCPWCFEDAWVPERILHADSCPYQRLNEERDWEPQAQRGVRDG